MSGKLKAFFSVLLGGRKTDGKMVTSFLYGLPFLILGFSSAGFNALFLGGDVTKNGVILAGKEKEEVALIFVGIGVISSISWVFLYLKRRKGIW